MYVYKFFIAKEGVKKTLKIRKSYSCPSIEPTNLRVKVKVCIVSQVCDE